MTDSFQKLKAAGDAYERDVRQVIEISTRLVASAEGVHGEKGKPQDKLAKLGVIEAQMGKLRTTAQEALGRYNVAIDEVHSSDVEKARALCSLAVASGRGDAAISYLLGECHAFAAAKGDLALRRNLYEQFVDTLASVACAAEQSAGLRPVTTGDGALETFEALEGAEAAEFYREHRKQILSAEQVRINNSATKA